MARKLQEAIVDDFILDAALQKYPEALVKVVTRPEARNLSGGLSERTWQRLDERGDLPAKTQLSDNRVGYRLIDIFRWLEARRRRGPAQAQPASPSRRWRRDIRKLGRES
jgi:predicted DNA-binding transcriptional regulator AlpA